jgi:L-asparaginase II
MPTSQPYVPLFEATRGKIVESIQYGAFVLVSADGRIQGGLGDPELVTYLRSSAKPFQALPFMERRGDEHYHLAPREVAIMCASHTGTDLHDEVVRSFQQKAGLSEDQLMCGVHSPFDHATWKKMVQEGRPSTPNRHNCSGKHTGMLALAGMLGVSQENYVDPVHPIQRLILQTFAEMTGLQPSDVVVGIDGCSAPNFAVPLRASALAFARLCDPTGLPAERADACRRITRAMSQNSLMIAGPERFDTLLMEIASGKIVSKMGAEGYMGLGILPGAIEPGSQALGLGLKISDGDELTRARPIAALQVLRDLGVLSKTELDQLANFDRKPIYNFRHLEVGEYRPAFSLH